jgi:hypothetical protein
VTVVYFVQHGPYHNDFEVARWENKEGKITKLVVQTSLRTRAKAAVALEFWREQEREKNGKAD